jgi:hypothetical protein
MRPVAHSGLVSGQQRRRDHCREDESVNLFVPGERGVQQLRALVMSAGVMELFVDLRWIMRVRDPPVGELCITRDCATFVDLSGG